MKKVNNEKMKIHSMKKITKNKKIERIKEPEFFYISLLQNIGVSTKETVQSGTYVKRFQIIGESQGEVSSKIHSPVSGYVTEISEKRLHNGIITKVIKIKNDYLYIEEETITREMKDLDEISVEEILDIIEGAGIVGQGGAQFPTNIKYNKKNKKIKSIVLNAVECEPYLTSDYIVMKNYTKEIFYGIKIIKKVLDTDEIIIATGEDNKELNNILSKFLTKGISVKFVPDIYPQGSEQLLIKAIFKKEIEKSKLPIDEGIVVSNIGTVKAVYDAFIEGKPLVERIVTISGERISETGNYLMKIGTTPKHLLENFTITDSLDNTRIIFGGPMMGNEIIEMDTGITKGTNGVLFLSNEIDKVQRKNCILCGYCSSVCPMYLMPMKFEEFYRKGKYNKLKIFNLNSCIECGACEYICPSRVALIENIKLGKEKLKKLGGAKNG